MAPDVLPGTRNTSVRSETMKLDVVTLDGFTRSQVHLEFVAETASAHLPSGIRSYKNMHPFSLSARAN